MRKLFPNFVRELLLMTRMMGPALGVILTVLILLRGVSSGEDLSPEATVYNYYNALKKGQFEQAYDYLSPRMTNNKTREQWTADMKRLFESGEVQILEFSVSPLTTDGNKARVKVWNRSKDILSPKEGIAEHEIDYLIKEKGLWKIDETVVSPEK